MKEQAMPTTMTEDEKDREALATRMREAIIRELIPENDDRAEEGLFKGRDQRMVLGAIADWPQASLCMPTMPMTATTATGV
jgi:hypothetical protein